MGLFGSRKVKDKIVKVFIVEDSKVYAAQLEHFLKQRFADKVLISCFPVAEVMDVKLAHNQLPDLIIMDYVLNARFDDAESGIEAMKRIKEGYPGIEMVLHTSLENYVGESAGALDGKYRFIPKNQEGMDEIAELVQLIANS